MSLTDAYRASIRGELDECMFCNEEIDNPGLAFMEHIEESAACKARYEDWLVNLDMDRPGGG